PGRIRAETQIDVEAAGRCRRRRRADPDPEPQARPAVAIEDQQLPRKIDADPRVDDANANIPRPHIPDAAVRLERELHAIPGDLAAAAEDGRSDGEDSRDAVGGVVSEAPNRPHAGSPVRSGAGADDRRISPRRRTERVQ